MLRAATVTLIALLLATLAAHATAEDPWADAVVQAVQGPDPVQGPFADPARALGPPRGGGTYAADNSSLFCLGRPNGYVVLRFDTAVTDDPDNPLGLDCIVFGNSFWVGGNPQRKWQEPGLIEISEDVNGNGLADDPWYLIPGSREYRYPLPQLTEPPGSGNSESEPGLLTGNITNPNIWDADPGNDGEEYNWGYFEMTPTLPPYLDNYVRPSDPFTVGHEPGTGGGDAFDIAWAVDTNGDPAGITQFHFIRLSSFIDRSTGTFGYASPEVDAVADVAPDVDTDGDGILDEYETRVAGTDPNRPESTVLALEIPGDEGGSPSGTELGTAEDALGTRLTLVSSGQRSYGLSRNVTVDLLAPARPDGALPQGGLLFSGTVREIVSSEPDFQAAEVAPAEITIEYTSAEIAGLDEAGLAPYRFDGTAYTQDGLDGVELNADANRVSFRSRYPGVFVLASAAGSGDTGATTGPQGRITLSAAPPGGVPVVTGTVAVTSGIVLDHEGAPVSNGALFTVATSAGSIATPDASPGVPGVQVAASGGMIAFDVNAPTVAGSATLTAASVEGSAFGDLTYPFLAGPPAPPVYWIVGQPIGTGPVTLQLTSGPIVDAYGNTVQNGTLITVAITNATFVSGDADSGQPGFQATVTNGRAEIFVQVATGDTRFPISVYADSAMTQLLGDAELAPSDYRPLPLNAGGVTALALLAAGVAALARTARRTPRRVRRGFTLVELLIVIGIITILSAILLPVLSRAQAAARSTQCVSNLRQLYLANTMYAAENKGHYVPAAPDIYDGFGGRVRWHGERKKPGPDSEFDPNRGPLAEYLPDGRVKECPEFTEFRRAAERAGLAFESGSGGYGYNMAYVGSRMYADEWPESVTSTTRDSEIRRPGQTVMFADAGFPMDGYIIEYSFLEPPHHVTPDSPAGEADWGYADPSLHFRHMGRVNVIWCDGHISSEPWGWAPATNIYLGNNRRHGVGWFGPRNNRLFDVRDKEAYQAAG